MHVQFPIFILSLLVHTGIYLTSGKRDRLPKLVAGLLVLMSSWVIWYGGQLLQARADMALPWLTLAMRNAPYYMPLFSFLVYYRRGGKPALD